MYCTQGDASLSHHLYLYTFMSAFAAFRKKSVTELFSNEEEDDEEIKYEIGSSDEEVEDKQIIDSDRTRPSSATPTITPSVSRLVLVPEISESRFIPDDDNFLVFDDHIIVGLKTNEYLLVSGQCKITVQRGAVKLNEVDYHHADPERSISIVASFSQSLPMISSTQILDRDGVRDTQNDHNKHLFSSDYKSVVMIANYSTGVEDIGLYWRPFKRFFGFGGESDVELLGEMERLFQSYTFEIVLRNNGSLGMNLDAVWGTDLKSLCENITEDLESSVTMIIGNKNSGKSTLSKTLTNALLLKQRLPVAYLDLDPGQSEFSAPFTLSLTLIHEPIYGMYLFNPHEVVSSHYYGFTTPQQHPDLYISIAKSLLHSFISKLKAQGINLVINTPGWIKGFGMEILNNISNELEPDHLILLSGNLDPGSPENADILSTITHKKSHIFQGIYHQSKYSPSQLRTWNKLLYFHRQNTPSGLHFDFKTHILDKPPLRLPYQVEEDPSFCGLNSVLFLNVDPSEVGKDNIALLLDASIVGFYLIDYEYYSSYQGLQLISPDQPLIMRLALYSDMIDFRATEVLFAGLGMIHSIDTARHCFNIYLPFSVKENLEKHLSNGMKLVMVKGEGDIPPAEFLKPELLKSVSKKSADGSNLPLPYISFESNKVAGVWKMRRNVMRRGQR